MEWQPIETAPRTDDIEILICGHYESQVGIHWDYALVNSRNFEPSGAECSDAYCCATIYFEPTHWMLPPAPPSIDGDDEESDSANLIAAAQDLYDALEEAINLAKMPFDRSASDSAFDKAVAALAKARGEPI